MTTTDYTYVPGCQCERCWQRTDADHTLPRFSPMMADVLRIMHDGGLSQDEAVHHAYRFGWGSILTGSQLREWRKRLGLSQDRLARLLGVSMAAVQSWEVGRRPIRHPEMVAARLREIETQKRAEAQP